MQALKTLGLFDAVFSKVHPSNYSSKGFMFYSGMGDHQLIYDVRIVAISV